ncbi:MAG: DNA gyrase subunit A [Alphaproteobacteria bacterium]
MPDPQPPSPNEAQTQSDANSSNNSDDNSDSGGNSNGIAANGSTPPTPPTDNTAHISLEEEMRHSYLDYAMSVIVARALPDVRDGLKPVQRRILHAMKESGYDWNRGLRKSARIVGEVMSKYHPHGESAIYEALVRLAQDFTMRSMLIEGQGNFGSMDDDPPAAMRYTEARLQRLASEGLLEDMDRDTVDFQPSYDETGKEPVVLPARFPNLLVNGAQGIAVGMATSVPPHNLGEVVEACRAYIINPDISTDELMKIIPGPDFPTGGVLLAGRSLRIAYETGRGRGSLRARAQVERETGRNGREILVVTEVAPGVSKGLLLNRLAHVVREKIVEGISDIRDESARGGVRVVIELKRGAMPEVVLNRLWKHTPLQSHVGFNLRAIYKGRPHLFPVREIIAHFISFREEVIARRTVWNLTRARARAHVALGLTVAVSNIDEIITLIRASSGPEEARITLMSRRWTASGLRDLQTLIDDPNDPVSDSDEYRLSEIQARAILELRLQRLTALERDKLTAEIRELSLEIEEALTILCSREKMLSIVDAELADIAERFATPRRTELRDHIDDQSMEDLIHREAVVITLTHGGYVKRVPVSSYRAQRRGGKGRNAMSTHDDDFVSNAFVTDSHARLLFFSSRGMVYSLKAWELPEGSARGKSLVNLLPLESEESITALLPMPPDPEERKGTDLVFATNTGTVRRNRLSDFESIHTNGKIAMKLEKGAHLIGVATAKSDNDVLLATAQQRVLRFALGNLRVFNSRNSMGVRGIRLAKGDRVISLAILAHSEATPGERKVYLVESRARRVALRGKDAARGEEEEVIEGDSLDEVIVPDDEDMADDKDLRSEAEGVLSAERYAEMEDAEEIILSLSADGYGKRASSHRYPTRGRGGRGVRNAPKLKGEGFTEMVSVFPIEDEDEVMLITDCGRMIRTDVADISIVGRTSRGVRVLRIAEDTKENLVSVTRLVDASGANGEAEGGEGGNSEADNSEDKSGAGEGTEESGVITAAPQED